MRRDSVPSLQKFLGDEQSSLLFCGRVAISQPPTLNFMPPLRPIVFPRYRGYVCPSCTAKIQARSFPPWLARAASSTPPTTSKKKKAPRRDPRHTSDRKVTIRQYDEGPDGSWEPVHEDPDEDQIDQMDIHKMQSQLKELQAELKDAKGERTEDNPFPNLPFYKEIASGRFSLLEEVDSGCVPCNIVAFLQTLIISQRFMTRRNASPWTQQ